MWFGAIAFAENKLIDGSFLDDDREPMRSTLLCLDGVCVQAHVCLRMTPCKSTVCRNAQCLFPYQLWTGS